MEFCSGGECVWAWGGPWVVAGNFLNGPQLGDVKVVLVGKF